MNVSGEVGQKSDAMQIEFHWMGKKVSQRFTLHCCFV